MHEASATDDVRPFRGIVTPISSHNCLYGHMVATNWLVSNSAIFDKPEKQDGCHDQLAHASAYLTTSGYADIIAILLMCI